MVFKLTKHGVDENIVETNFSTLVTTLYANVTSENSSTSSGFALDPYDSVTDMSQMNHQFLFHPKTSGLSSAAFTNNSQIMTVTDNGAWSHGINGKTPHTFTTTSTTPDGSNSVILQGKHEGYGSFVYANSTTYTIAYWIRFTEDSDHPDFTLNGSLNRGGTLFTLGNTNNTGIQINIQFETTTGYLRPFVNGISAPINSIAYQQTKFLKDTWHLFALSIIRSNGNFTCRIFVNGIEQFTFDVEQCFIDAYNQENSTSITTLSETGFNLYWSNSNDFLEYICSNVIFIRDFIADYYLFDLWKIYALDRELTNSEHLSFYQSIIGISTVNTIDQVTINANKKSIIDVVFSVDNVLPNSETPYTFQLNNVHINENDLIIANVHTDNPSIFARVFCIQEGYCKISVYNSDTSSSFSDTLRLSLDILT